MPWQRHGSSATKVGTATIADCVQVMPTSLALGAKQLHVDMPLLTLFCYAPR